MANLSRKKPDHGKASHAHGLREVTLWKWPFTKSLLQIQRNLYQNPNAHLIHHRNRKTNPKIYMQPQKTPESQTILSKKNNAGGITIRILRYITEP